MWVDPGWDHIPGTDSAERELLDRLMLRATKLSDGMRELVVADLARRATADPLASALATTEREIADAPVDPSLTLCRTGSCRINRLQRHGGGVGHYI